MTVANEARITLIPQTPSYSADPVVFTFADVDWFFGTSVANALTTDPINIEKWTLEMMNNI